MARHDSSTPHPLLTDEPGLVLNRPRRQLAKILVLYALLSLVCAGAASFIAVQVSNLAMQDRVEALEADLAGRRAASAEANQERDARLTQTRRDLCVVVDRIQPRDKAVQDVRRRYGCTGGPTATPTPSPPAAGAPRRPTGPPAEDGGGGPSGQAPASNQRGSSGSGPAGPTGPQGPSGPPAPAPPPPAPPADEPHHLLDVCVPLLDVCL